MQCPPQILTPLVNMSKTILIVHIVHLFVIQNIQSAIILFTFFILNIVEVQQQ